MLHKEMDQHAERIIQIKAEIAELEDQIENKKASIKGITNLVQEYFSETKRKAPVVTPFGTLYLKNDISVPSPKGANLKTLFEHFVKIEGEEKAWEKLTISNPTLKKELKEHTQRLEERGDDPLLEPLPGVAMPKSIQTLIFTKGRK